MLTRNITLLLIMLAWTAGTANGKETETTDTTVLNKTATVYNVGDFHNINCESRAKIIFTQAKKCSVKSVSDTQQDVRATVSVENGTLTIADIKSDCTFYVEAPDLRRLTTSGFSKVKLNNLKVKDLVLVSESGSTSITTGNIKCNNLTIKTDGFSKYKIDG